MLFLKGVKSSLFQQLQCWLPSLGRVSPCRLSSGKLGQEQDIKQWHEFFYQYFVMLMFTSILKFNAGMVPERTDVPVCFGNIVIGNCRFRLKDNEVTGMFKLDEEILGGVDFYYQIYPLKGNKLDSIQVNFIPGCSFLMENPEAETTN